MRQGRPTWRLSTRRGRVICEAERIRSHYLPLYAGKVFRALHLSRSKRPGFSLYYQLMRLCRFAEQIALPRHNPRPSLL
jgi:hypothetical protein